MTSNLASSSVLDLRVIERLKRRLHSIHAAWRRRLSEIIQARINEAVHQAIPQHPESATDGVRLTAIFEPSLSRLHSLRRAEATKNCGSKPI